MAILRGVRTFIDTNLLERLGVGPLVLYLEAYLNRLEREGFLPSSGGEFPERAEYVQGVLFRTWSFLNAGRQGRIYFFESDP